MQRVKREWWAKRRARHRKAMQRIVVRRTDLLAVGDKFIAPSLVDEFSRHKPMQDTLAEIDRKMHGNQKTGLTERQGLIGFDCWSDHRNPPVNKWPFDFSHDPPDFSLR